MKTPVLEKTKVSIADKPVAPKPQADCPTANPIDQRALAKLLSAQPPEPALVNVNCDHRINQWVVRSADGKTRFIRQGVLTNVTLHSRFEERGGCGGQYVGTAEGNLTWEGKPTSTPKGLSKLTFDTIDGEFSLDGEIVNRVDFLILEPDCRNSVITKDCLLW